LDDLDKAHVFESNNAFTLTVCENVKWMLKDYQRALKDLAKDDVLEPNNASTLRSCERVKNMLDDY